ncbi:phosphopantetheine-binding protein [Alkalilimnicola ehrlichii]|uniref:Phosphopantetheine-binding protein n=1 Tax=Alkalilimnicola ehrlichii TaxID=351052 RepID=A0A3E0WVU9_9GAMM|nr:acyl carrier protein [Alkalilimnicola ehrlichii]RFA29214.1 phosphopantetheine-binding protein [Alkalilimnicola ehrlichii]RFA36125.1 phosphopantetheine-binding protein [Alkalilimnicola ehrlichii]
MSLDDIIDMVSQAVAAVLDTDPQSLDRERPFHELGIDSVLAVGLSAEFEDTLGVVLDPEIAFEHDTVNKVSHYLHTLVNP